MANLHVLTENIMPSDERIGTVDSVTPIHPMYKAHGDDNDFIGMAANRLDQLQTKYTVNCKRKNKENTEK